MTDSKRKTVQQNKAEVERITAIIENHCLFQKMTFENDTFTVHPGEGFRPAMARNKNKRLSLIDVAMYLEKLWTWSFQVKSDDWKIERVIKFRNENDLHA